MRATDFIKLSETPLPADWDNEVYTPTSSYKKRIEYAVARAQKVGKGSSRTVFEIEYEGRSTVLKVAHNIKGMAQNEAEANILSDGYAQHLDIIIPLIDYDEKHLQPVWIHTEKGTRATNSQLCKMMQCPSLELLIGAAIYFYTGEGHDPTSQVMQYYNTTNRDDIETFFQYVDELQELLSLRVNIRDFTTKANWAIYKGRPVVIDLGFNDEIKDKYYSR